MKHLKFGDTLKLTKEEANKGIAFFLAYMALLMGFVYVAHNYWGW